MGRQTAFPDVESVITCPRCRTPTLALQAVSPAIFLSGMFAQYICDACKMERATFVSVWPENSCPEARPGCARNAARG
jgi:hypothetical protein